MFGMGVLFTWIVISFLCAFCNIYGKGGVRMGDGVIANIILAPATLTIMAEVMIFGALKYFFMGIDKRIKAWYNMNTNKRKR